jgi:hypothetical protein
VKAASQSVALLVAPADASSDQALAEALVALSDAVSP